MSMMNINDQGPTDFVATDRLIRFVFSSWIGFSLSAGQMALFGSG